MNDDDRVLVYPNHPIPCPSCGDGIVVLTFWAYVLIWLQSRWEWHKERKALERADEKARRELRQEAEGPL